MGQRSPTLSRSSRALTALGSLLDRMPVRMAVNRSYAEPGTLLAPGDELALIPPISGGRRCPRPGDRGAVVVEALADMVGRPSAGAVVAFQGVTREVGRLDYEAYREMAEERIAEILRECIQPSRPGGAAAEHRTARSRSGEPSVIVAVRPRIARKRSPGRARQSTGSRPRRRSGSGRSRATAARAGSRGRRRRRGELRRGSRRNEQWRAEADPPRRGGRGADGRRRSKGADRARARARARVRMARRRLAPSRPEMRPRAMCSASPVSPEYRPPSRPGR